MLYRRLRGKTVPYNPHSLSLGFGRILKRNNSVAFFLSWFKTLSCPRAVWYGSARKIHVCTSRSFFREYSQNCLRPYYLGTAKRIRFGYSESFFRLLILLFRVNFSSVFASRIVLIFQWYLHALKWNTNSPQTRINKEKPAVKRVLCYGALKKIRTPDLLVRSQTLYPAELSAHTGKFLTAIV